MYLSGLFYWKLAYNYLENLLTSRLSRYFHAIYIVLKIDVQLSTVLVSPNSQISLIKKQKLLIFCLSDEYITDTYSKSSSVKVLYMVQQ